MDDILKILKSTYISNIDEIKVKIKENEQCIQIFALLGGFQEGSIELAFNENNLTIRGERPIPDTMITGTEFNVLNTIFFGPFSRNIVLPRCITNKDSVRHAFKNGLLEIVIDKDQNKEAQFSVRI